MQAPLIVLSLSLLQSLLTMIFYMWREKRQETWDRKEKVVFKETDQPWLNTWMIIGLLDAISYDRCFEIKGLI